MTCLYAPHDRRPNEETHETDDQQAEVIAALTTEEADRLWWVIVQLKPHLND